MRTTAVCWQTTAVWDLMAQSRPRGPQAVSASPGKMIWTLSLSSNGKDPSVLQAWELVKVCNSLSAQIAKLNTDKIQALRKWPVHRTTKLWSGPGNIRAALTTCPQFYSWIRFRNGGYWNVFEQLTQCWLRWAKNDRSQRSVGYINFK